MVWISLLWWTPTWAEPIDITANPSESASGSRVCLFQDSAPGAFQNTSHQALEGNGSQTALSQHRPALCIHRDELNGLYNITLTPTDENATAVAGDQVVIINGYDNDDADLTLAGAGREGASAFLGHGLAMLALLTGDALAYASGGSGASFWGSEQSGPLGNLLKPLDYGLLAASFMAFDGLQTYVFDHVQPSALAAHGITGAVAALSSLAAYGAMYHSGAVGSGYMPRILASYLLSPALAQLTQVFKLTIGSLVNSISTEGADKPNTNQGISISVPVEAVTTAMLWGANWLAGSQNADMAVKLLAPGLGIAAGYQTMTLLNKTTDSVSLAGLTGLLSGAALLADSSGAKLPELGNNLVEAATVNVVGAQGAAQMLSLSAAGLLILTALEHGLEYGLWTESSLTARVQKNMINGMAVLLGFNLYGFLTGLAENLWSNEQPSVGASTVQSE